MEAKDNEILNESLSDSFFKRFFNKFGVLSPICAAFAIPLALFAASLVTDIFNKDSLTYTYSLLIVFGAYSVIFIIAAVIFLILFSNIKNKELKMDLKKIQKTAGVNLDKIIDILRTVNNNILTEYLVSGDQVYDMEANIVKGNTIHICTSKFVLEKNEEFKNVIITNLRKGVIYKYIIPEGSLYFEDYCKMMKEWYKDFSDFLKDQSECEKCLKQSEEDKKHGKFWNRDYLELINMAKDAFNIKDVSKRNTELSKIENTSKKLFSKQIETFSINEQFFYVTVAMYEQPNRKWKAIIKLPTIDKDKSYMAFYIPDENELEKETFVGHIRTLCEKGVKKPFLGCVFER